MEVHPPEHAIHNWRDFFVHIGTITIGLLIAIGLEQTVELIHHRHQRHAAERNLEREFEQNRAILAEDERQLAISQKQITALQHIVAAPHQAGPITPSAWPRWNWSNFLSAAWDTARSSDTTNLLPFNELQELNGTYSQQAIVNAQASMYIRDIYDVDTPLIEEHTNQPLTPDDLRKLQTSLDRASADLAYLTDLCHSLERVYALATKKEPVA